MLNKNINPPTKGRVFHFDSIQTILDMECTNKYNNDYWLNNIMKREDKQPKWFGTGLTSTVDTLKALGQGWKHGLKKSEEMDEKMPPPNVHSVRRRNIRGPEGEILDIHKVNKGLLDIAWTTKKRLKRQSKKRFTLTANICTIWNVHSDKQIPRGVACATLAKALIKAGHSVEVVAYMKNKEVIRDDKDPTTDCNTIFYHTIQIKNFDTPLDVPTLVSGVACAGFYRTLGFKIMCLDPFYAHDGMGYPDRNGTLPDEILGHKNSTVINVPPDLNDMKTAGQWLTNITDNL